MVLVSVLMGSYNHEKYIGDAIESVLNQTFTDLELIIVDDDSTDKTKEIIKSYAAKDTRLHAFFHGKNMGISRTANDGLKEAKGTYISFIGSDDWWAPNKLEKQVPLISKYENKIIWSQGETISENKELDGIKLTDFLKAPKQKNGNIFQELLKEDFVFGQSVLVKAEYAKQFGFSEDLRYVNDHLFFVNLAKNHDFLFINEPLAKYRLHKKNTSNMYSEQWLIERIIVRNFFLEQFYSEISAGALSDIYCKIGQASSRLGKKGVARKSFLRALILTPFHPNILLNLMLSFTAKDSFMEKFLTNYYRKINYLIPFY